MLTRAKWYIVPPTLHALSCLCVFAFTVLCLDIPLSFLSKLSCICNSLLLHVQIYLCLQMNALRAEISSCLLFLVPHQRTRYCGNSANFCWSEYHHHFFFVFLLKLNISCEVNLKNIYLQWKIILFANEWFNLLLIKYSFRFNEKDLESNMPCINLFIRLVQN